MIKPKKESLFLEELKAIVQKYSETESSKNPYLLPTDLPPKLLKQYISRAKKERTRGAKVVVNLRVPYVSVKIGDQSYFFQGEQAENLLSEVPSNIDTEDYLLAIAQAW